MRQPILFLVKGGSGSRMIAEFLEKCGVYMGWRGNLNSSYDSLLFTHNFQRRLLLPRFKYGSGCVYGNKSPIRRTGRNCIQKHLKKYEGGRWGFKTCDAMFSFPLYNTIFPNAKYIQLVRDSRDVILSKEGRHNLCHADPNVRKRYWEYFKIITFGLSNDMRKFKFFMDDYRVYDILFKYRFFIQAKACVEHLIQLKQLRNEGLISKDNSIVVKYEDFCLDSKKQGQRLCEFLGIKFSDEAIKFCEEDIHTESVKKWEKRSGLENVHEFLSSHNLKYLFYE